jgi:hypothetical protein
MSRRSRQNGALIQQTGWWRVRFRLDQPGVDGRKHMSVKVAPVSMRLTKPELERRAKEIVQNAGANSEERFNRLVLGDVTFREQSKIYLQTAVSRKRNPVLRQNSVRTENSAIPCRDGCLIQVIPSPSDAKNLSRGTRAVHLYI